MPILLKVLGIKNMLVLDDGRLERMLIANKCRVEKTKKNLELMYTFRTFNPDIMEMYDVNNVTLQDALRSWFVMLVE